MTTFLLLLGVAAFAVLCGALHYFHRRHINDQLETWASHNGYAIVSRKFRPYDDDTTVCRIVVRDHEGRERTGAVRSGLPWSRNIDARLR